MSTSIDSIKQSCEGRCILEMQKILEPSLITEFFEVVRDFQNDDTTAAKLRAIILCETSKAVELIEEKTSAMISLIDDIFMNRRQKQSSFYCLCHKLARKALPGSSNLPDESKCVCCSDENMKKLSVVLRDYSGMDFSSNFSSVEEAIQQYMIELQCANCGKLCQSSNNVMSSSNCSCSSPSVASQHKVHKAFLEHCKANGEGCQDSWYLTQLQRDADYYEHARSSISSNESTNSFEVLSQPGFEEENNESDIEEDNFHTEKEMLYVGNEVLDTLQKVPLCPIENRPAAALIRSLNGNLGSTYLVPSVLTVDIQTLSKTLDDKLKQSFKLQHRVTDEKKGSIASADCKAATNNELCEKKFCPADILKQSFISFFNKCNNASHPTKKYYYFAKTRPAECLGMHIKKLQVGSKPQSELRNANKSISPSAKEKKSNPSDSLKYALNSYFKKEMSDNWLRN